jgi:SAM-dependent methyltransferase
LDYNLGPRCRILDVGCGKAHLLHELKQIYPHSTVRGFDPSEYAIANAPEAIRPALSVGRAQDPKSYRGLDVRSFDLVLAMGSLHNLKNFERREAYRNISEVGGHKYLWVESYRNAQEQFNLQCWALTCWAFLSEEEWLHEFHDSGYYGDYEFVYFT